MTLWDEQYENGQGRYFPNEELVRFLGRVYGPFLQGTAEGKSAVEIGCGVGGNLWALSQWGFFAHGLETSNKAIELAHNHALRNRFSNRILLTRYTAPQTIKLPAGSVSLVIDVHTIQHLSDADHGAMYTEIHRILGSGGRFFGVHWCGNPEAVKRIFPAHPELCQWQYSHKILSKAVNSGLRLESVAYITKTYTHTARYGKWLVLEAVKP